MRLPALAAALCAGFALSCAASAQTLSNLPAASGSAANDIFPATQGSTGPGTGTTRKVTLLQIMQAVQGTGLQVASNQLQVVYGTAGGTAAQGNDARIVGALQVAGGTMTGNLGFSGLAYLTVPSWASPVSTAAGVIGWNSTTGRYDFGTGGAAIQYVDRLGDTLQGPLHMGSNVLDGSNIAFTGGTLDGVAIGATTPAAIQATSVSLTSGFLKLPLFANVAAAGTNQGTAAPLTAQVNVITSCSTGQGVSTAQIPTQAIIVVLNRSGNPCNVYPGAGAQLDSAGPNVAEPIANLAGVSVLMTSATQGYLF
jgi:hypothetical protein